MSQISLLVNWRPAGAFYCPRGVRERPVFKAHRKCTILNWRGAMRAKGWFKLLLAVLTAGAAVASAWIFQHQLTAMQDQLTVMKADQRPWIGLDRFEPSSAANGQGFEFAAIVRNTGRTAAR